MTVAGAAKRLLTVSSATFLGDNQDWEEQYMKTLDNIDSSDLLQCLKFVTHDYKKPSEIHLQLTDDQIVALVAILMPNSEQGTRVQKFR